METLTQDGLTARIELSPDRFKAFAEFECEADAEISVATVQALLSKKIPPEFLHTNLLEDVVKELKQKRQASKRRIARSKPAVASIDERVVLLVKLYRKLQDGEKIEFVDMRFIKHFDNIEADTAVARLYHPVTGTPGVDVFGKEVKVKPPKPAKVKFDGTIKQVSSKEHPLYDELVSVTHGLLFEEKGQLAIKPVLEIEGDIDYRFGDIDFIGEVKIKGNVMKGFSITARESITVDGDVYSASLLSREGNITIHGAAVGAVPDSVEIDSAFSTRPKEALLGTEPTRLTASGSVEVLVVDGAIIRAAQSLLVTKSISHSDVAVGTSLKISEGSLISGKTSLVETLSAHTIGVAAQANTLVTFKSRAEAAPEYQDLLQRKQSNLKAKELLLLYLGSYAENPERINDLRRDHRLKLQSLIEKLALVNKSLEGVEGGMSELRKEAMSDAPWTIAFENSMHPGIRITALGKTTETSKKISGPDTFIFDSKALVFKNSEGISLS